MSEDTRQTREARRLGAVEVVRVGERLLLPENMTPAQGIEVLKRQMKYEEEVVAIDEMIDVFPWEGALALNKAMKIKYGWATAEPTPGWFGPTPPKLLAVEVSLGTTINVIWGRFSIPNVEGWVATATEMKDGRLVFKLTGEVKRKYERTIKELATLTREIANRESIYRGKAFSIHFKDADGDDLTIPTPKFLDLSQVKPAELIFPADVEEAVQVSVFTPIERTEECRVYGIPLKRGVLAEGPYGVGKTLLAYNTAKKAVENRWTYLYGKAAELSEMIRFVRHRYEPAVLFVEDIDRETSGERDTKLDNILNTIDGIDSKNSEIMVVLTTNHVEKINRAMLRPGRLDAVISVRPPDALAAQRLVRLYGRETIPSDEDLAAVGEALGGKIPAIIRETVERAKLAAIHRIRPGGSFTVTAEDLLVAARGMETHLDLLKEPEKDTRTPMELFGHAIVDGITGAAARVGRKYDLTEVIPNGSKNSNSHAPALPAVSTKGLGSGLEPNREHSVDL